MHDPSALSEHSAVRPSLPGPSRGDGFVEPALLCYARHCGYIPVSMRAAPCMAAPACLTKR